MSRMTSNHLVISIKIYKQVQVTYSAIWVLAGAKIVTLLLVLSSSAFVYFAAWLISDGTLNKPANVARVILQLLFVL